MTDATRSKPPKQSTKAEPPETHRQTRKVEEKLSPPHHATESYGKAELKGKLPRR